MSRYTIHVPEAPEREAAERLREALSGRERPTLAVSGGSTPKRLFQTLAREYRESIPWERLSLFQVDERCVPPDHLDSNWGMIHQELLEHLPIAAAFRMEAEHGEEGARAYETLLRGCLPADSNGIPRLDVVLLGMGDDGHCASLFPDTSALEEQERLVVMNHVPQLDTSRMTMTYPLLDAASHRWFLVRGGNKRDAFLRTQRGETPSGRLRDAEWFISRDVSG